MTGDMGRTTGGIDPWSDRLSEYLDGDLKAADRTRLEQHLTSCVACAAALAELREVVARAHALEDVPPARDLWPAIEAQLEPRTPKARVPVRQAPVVKLGAWWTRRFEFGVPQLAAAAMLLIGISAAGVWVALRGVSPVAGPIASVPGAGSRPDTTTPAVSRPAPGPAISPGGIEPGAMVAAASPLANPRYDAAVAELERALAEGRGRLDPRTLKVVEDNLRVIDRALEEARRAVAADPGNTWLRSHLASTMQRKVDLLRSATLLASAQG